MSTENEMSFLIEREENQSEDQNRLINLYLADYIWRKDLLNQNLLKSKSERESGRFRT